MSKTNIQLSEPFKQWREVSVRNITFVLTEDCQLRCKYCYICGKNSFAVMSFDVAKQAIDYVLTHQDIFNDGSVVWDFIGGEPLLEVQLMDEICDYAKIRMFELNHPWFDNYRINISSNGLLYDNSHVQKFLAKNRTHVSIMLSVDGTKQKHNQQRVYPNGKGCYDDVVKQIPQWLAQYPNASTKATLSHDDLPMVKDSVLHLWQLGIMSVGMNCIFEDVWQDGDDTILEEQLVALADEIIDKKLYEKYQCTLFDRNIGFPLDRVLNNENWCGAGRMLGITTSGDFVPCIRFAQYSLEHQKQITVGNIRDGYDTNKLRSFLTLKRLNQSSPECIDCEVASGCAWCQGFNYDTAETDTIFQRATYICKMHKARVRANNYLWNKLDKIVPPPEDDVRLRRLQKRKRLQSVLLLADANAPSFCHYKTQQVAAITQMSVETLRKVVYYALTNNLSLNVIAGNEPLSNEFRTVLNECNHIILRSVESKEVAENSFDIFDYETNTWNDSFGGEALILRINRRNLPQLPDFLAKHSLAYNRISLVIKDLTEASGDDFAVYQSVLDSLVNWLPEREEQKPLELSFLTDRLILTEPNHCEAGIKHISIAPTGNFYLCPGFYYQGAEPITDIDTVLQTHALPIKNQQLLQLDHAPICEHCDAYHCKRCVYLNKQTTLEVNTPSRQQCVYAHLERNASRTLIEPLFLQDDVSIAEIDYLDPFDELQKREQPKGEKTDEC
ncbi:MAG: radical SAM peptide maturase, CXXX-repeat target family [Planctomycetaceae bacterium]|jgi:radical SAM peptide maturase (CXXX-repeat target family)/CXXX repeat peptide maturase|nr:radical SAM peptide maturase, CXXX-repeat target family [Planctomycetaceae bacterium]